LFGVYHLSSEHFCTSIITALIAVKSCTGLVHNAEKQTVIGIPLAQKLFAKFLGSSTSTEVILFANCSITRKKAIEGGLNCSRSYHIPSRELRLMSHMPATHPILAKPCQKVISCLLDIRSLLFSNLPVLLS
jgi:hypothetical protein